MSNVCQIRIFSKTNVKNSLIFSFEFLNSVFTLDPTLSIDPIYSSPIFNGIDIPKVEVPRVSSSNSFKLIMFF